MIPRTFRSGLGEGIVHAADSLFKLQRTFAALGVYPVIIKKAIGDIRCLLNFVNDASLFQRVNHTGRQIDEVPFLHGQVLHNFIPSVGGNHLAQLSFIMRILAIDDLGVALGFQKVPHFVFPRGIPQPG